MGFRVRDVGRVVETDIRATPSFCLCFVELQLLHDVLWLCLKTTREGAWQGNGNKYQENSLRAETEINMP